MNTNGQEYNGDNAENLSSAIGKMSDNPSSDALAKIRQRQRGKVVRGNAEKPRKKVNKNRSLFMEYVYHWYVVLLSLIMCFPAYLAEIFLSNLFIAKSIPPFWAALLTMLVGGFIATFPLLILNIVLVARKKYYAIAVQLVLMEFLGLAFFLHYKMAMAFA